MQGKIGINVFVVVSALVAVACGVDAREGQQSSESGLIIDGSEGGGSRLCGNGGPACPASEYCAVFNPGAQGPDLPGVCRPKLSEGGRCTMGAQVRPDMCAGGFVCVPAGSSAYCLAPRFGGVGDYCEGAGSYYRCQSGLQCGASQTCEAPPAPPPAPVDPPPSSGPQPGDDHGSCAGFNDAFYCGRNYVSSGDPNILYRCRGGRLIVQQVCANGCNAIRGPQNDHCF